VLNDPGYPSQGGSHRRRYSSLNSGANFCELMTNLLCSKDRSALSNGPGAVQTPGM
jgi:hypothetical protein